VGSYGLFKDGCVDPYGLLIDGFVGPFGLFMNECVVGRRRCRGRYVGV
jgi:hypothetical protein